MLIFLLLGCQLGGRSFIPFQIPAHLLEEQGIVPNQDCVLTVVYGAGQQELFREPAERVVWLGQQPVLFLGASGFEIPDQVSQRAEVRLELWLDPETLLTQAKIFPLKSGVNSKASGEYLAQNLLNQLASTNAGYLAQVTNYMANLYPSLDLVGDTLDLSGTSHFQGLATLDYGLVYDTTQETVVIPSPSNNDVLQAAWRDNSATGWAVNGYNDGLGTSGYFLNSLQANTNATVEILNISSGPGLLANCSFGRGIELRLDNANPEFGVYVNHYGTGVAGVYNQKNSSASSAALSATSEGSGFGLTVFATGTGPAAYFLGNVLINGTVSSSLQNITMEHPTQPETLEIQHQVIASDEALNIYSGNVKLTENGNQKVSFPDWFSGVNTDLRFQLTAVGEAAPNLHVIPSEDGSGFEIAGGPRNGRVSWQVTALRQDALNQKQEYQIEHPKPQLPEPLKADLSLPSKSQHP